MLDALSGIIAAETARPVPPAVAICAAYLRQHFGSAVAAILFYGAGLRQPLTADTLLDFYVLVDDPRVALRSVVSGTAAMVLPPNVYMFKSPAGADTWRAKVAVISRRGFTRGMTAFSSHLWGRFAQPVAIVHARDGAVRDETVSALSAAVRTFVLQVAPLPSAPFTARALWVRGLAECYGAELRPELSRAEELADAGRDRYEMVTTAVLGPPDGDGTYRLSRAPDPKRARLLWNLRRRWGKTTNLVRLMKAAFTFDGGLDYAVAKIARHTGVIVDISDNDRRHPLIAGLRVFLEARRRGGVR